MPLTITEVQTTETPNFKQHVVSIKADNRIIAEVEMFTYDDLPGFSPERFQNVIQLLINQIQQ